MGVDIETIKPGDGVTFPQPGQTVTAHYTGRTVPDVGLGFVFDSSGAPPDIPPGATLEFDVELVGVERA